MKLYYDPISKMYSATTCEGVVEFLGTATHTMLKLQDAEHGLSEEQAREALVNATLKNGQAVDIEVVKKYVGN